MKVQQRDGLGVNVSGIAIQTVTPAVARELVSLVHANKLVVITGQSFGEKEYVEFSRLLGRPQVYLQPHYHHPEWPEIFVSSSVEREGKKFGVRGTGRYWHTDYAFMPEPLSLTMVTPRIVPKTSRGTLYIDMEEMYRRLPARLRAFVDTHQGIHEGKWRYKVQASDIDRALIDIVKECEQLAPPAIHPAVIEHPVRKSRILYVNSGFTTGFEGVPYDEGNKWLEEINHFVERDENVHEKAWAEGEILFWDNRYLLHKAAYADVSEPSLSYRIGVYDNLPFYTNTMNGNEVRHAAVAG
jgi:taurine dioxygenase